VREILLDEQAQIESIVKLRFLDSLWRLCYTISRRIRAHTSPRGAEFYTSRGPTGDVWALILLEIV